MHHSVNIASTLITTLGDDDSAKKSLKWLARINGSDFNIDSVHLNDVELTAEKEKVPEPTFLETMRDFMKYRYNWCDS